MKKIAITGATGTVGTFLLSELIEHDVQIKAWKRLGSKTYVDSSKITWLTGELGDHHATSELVEGVDVVIHSAYAHIPGYYRGGEGTDLAHFLEKNLMGSLALMQAAYKAGVKAFVLLSSRATYGDCRSDKMLFETMACQPSSHYGALKRALEAFVQSYGLGEQWSIFSVRATGVYGITKPFSHTKWLDYISSALDGRLNVRPRVGTQVHGHDLAKAIWFLINQAEHHPGEIFNCSDVYVDEQKLLQTMRQYVSIAPSDAPIQCPPQRIMTCDKLTSLGFQFGGEKLFQETIRSIILKLQNKMEEKKHGERNTAFNLK